MKILYTLGQFVYSGHQVLFFTINQKNQATEDYQLLAEHTFTESFKAKNKMFMGFDTVQHVDPPAMGDVVWTHTSGNQFIACGIWQDAADGPIDFEAFRVICRSVIKKAHELKQLVVSAPLMTRNRDLNLWNAVYPIIEEEFKGTDIQVVVHVPTEDLLVQVLQTIGGPITSYQKRIPEIRFAGSQKE